MEYCTWQRGWQRLQRLEEYKSMNQRMNSSTYLERVQLFFLTNEVEDDKKVPIFLSVVGSKTYSLLRNLVAPTAGSTARQDSCSVGGHIEEPF